VLRRSIERWLGTWVGLLLAGAILLLTPSGPWLALTVMAVQVVIELVVVRNYALAAIFITAIALTIAAGDQLVSRERGLGKRYGDAAAYFCWFSHGCIRYCASRRRVDFDQLMADAQSTAGLRRECEQLDGVARHLDRAFTIQPLHHATDGFNARIDQVRELLTTQAHGEPPAV